MAAAAQTPSSTSASLVAQPRDLALEPRAAVAQARLRPQPAEIARPVLVPQMGEQELGAGAGVERHRMPGRERQPHRLR
jgi:hypothetical protein